MTTEEAIARGQARAKEAMAAALTNGNGHQDENESDVVHLSAYAVEQAALDAHDAGLCPIRAATDGTKKPLGEWKRWQTEMPSREQVAEWFGDGHKGMGLVTGKVSGGLELLEFEGAAKHAGTIKRFHEALRAAGLWQEWDRIRQGYSERTPGEGFHVLWRCDEIAGNTKLARRADPQTGEVQVLIETRGEGGFVIVAPSWGGTHPTGKPWVRIKGSFAHVATIHAELRNRILDIARSFDELGDEEEPERAKPLGEKGDGGTLPGFTLEHAEILEAAGFEHHHTDRKGNAHYTRPGKDPREGASLTVWADDGRCTPWSTSIAMPGEFITGQRLLTPWQLHVGLNHGGRFDEAAREWRREHGRPVGMLVYDPPPEFWDERPLLRVAHDFARHRRCSPWAVLGVVLCRLVAAVPPDVVLPPLTGGPLSLNLFLGLVGPSGAGKDASIAAGREAYDVGDVPSVGLGSGEGLLDQYVVYQPPKGDDPGGIVQHNDAMLFKAPEIQTLGALKGRTSATLMPALRDAWTGVELSFAYATRERRLRVKAHKYRLCLIVGIQPEHANVLLEETSGGTPQRFLWMPALDPDAPDAAPAAPEPLPEFRMPQRQSFVGGLSYIEVCPLAAEMVDLARIERLRGNGEALDGHALANRLKVAAVLGIADGRLEVGEDDWRLAGVIQGVSDATRASAAEALRAAAQRSNRARGEALAERDQVVREVLRDADAQAVERVAETILGKLEGEEWIGHGKLRHSLAQRDRDRFEDAIASLIEADEIEAGETEYRGQKGIRYRRFRGVQEGGDT